MSGHISLFSPQGTAPMPAIPLVRVLDEDGHEVLRGYYLCHKNRQPYCDEQLSDDDVEHIVVCDTTADWGMERQIRMARVTPPHTIEVIDDGL